MAAPKNPQNDRLYVPVTTTKKEVAPKRLLRTRPTFSQSLMVSVGISKLGCTDLIFVDPGVKINGAYYRDVLLSKQLLPVMREVSGEFFVFQQDNAPAHRARDTVRLLEQATPAFIPPELWPANSPDLNPVDYRIWSVVQQRVYQSCVHDVDELKQHCSKCGVTSTRASLTMQLTSGTSVFVHVCRQRADTSSICCKKQYICVLLTV